MFFNQMITTDRSDEGRKTISIEIVFTNCDPMFAKQEQDLSIEIMASLGNLYGNSILSGDQWAKGVLKHIKELKNRYDEAGGPSMDILPVKPKE